MTESQLLCCSILLYSRSIWSNIGVHDWNWTNRVRFRCKSRLMICHSISIPLLWLLPPIFTSFFLWCLNNFTIHLRCIFEWQITRIICQIYLRLVFIELIAVSCGLILSCLISKTSWKFLGHWPDGLRDCTIWSHLYLVYDLRLVDCLIQNVFSIDIVFEILNALGVWMDIEGLVNWS